ncbi:hypothetical protein [Methylomonas methanica]|uniref:Uncharacterized protein n=1 Tax=Methylomonas methanica (strain DSM 25384 / MC09) TaxID=857087 RepID=G0A682_METMM|nr:hypothetical protein [Methylomonas methanica]AEG01710.1 hypothetical protein Metme_3339 [Methylomonas methanica MC09]
MQVNPSKWRYIKAYKTMGFAGWGDLMFIMVYCLPLKLLFMRPAKVFLIQKRTGGAMKSVKKRFKMALAEVEKVAGELQFLTANMTLLEPVQEIASSVLLACKRMGRRVKQVHKVDFAEQMLEDDALLRLEEIVDNDVISVLEQRFSAALGEMGEGQVLDMMRQLLEKLEKKLALLNESIQRLGGVLNQSD